MESRKKVEVILLAKQKQNTDTENHSMDTKGEGRGGDGLGDWVDKYTLPCTQQITPENLAFSTGNSPRCSVATYVGRNKKQGCLYTQS